MIYQPVVAGMGFFLLIAQAALAAPESCLFQSRQTLHDQIVQSMHDCQEKNVALVKRAMTDLFVRRDLRRIRDYVAENYIQHNPFVANGRAALEQQVRSLPPGFQYEQGMIVGNNEIVMVHGRYRQAGQAPVIAVDIFRIKNGQLAEHWDILQDEVPVEKTVNGNPVFQPYQPLPE